MVIIELIKEIYDIFAGKTPVVKKNTLNEDFKKYITVIEHPKEDFSKYITIIDNTVDKSTFVGEPKYGEHCVLLYSGSDFNEFIETCFVKKIF